MPSIQSRSPSRKKSATKPEKGAAARPKTSGRSRSSRKKTDLPRHYWPEVAFRIAQNGGSVKQFAREIGVSPQYARKFLRGYEDIAQLLISNYTPPPKQPLPSYAEASAYVKAITNGIAYLEWRGLVPQEIAHFMEAPAGTVYAWAKKYRPLIDERKAWISSLPVTCSLEPLPYLPSYGFCDIPYLT